MLNVKKDFPIFKNNKDLVYLDNAATSQKPQTVIDAISNYYSHYNANIHRGIYKLSEKSTDMYKEARKKVANFIGAGSPKEIAFTKGTTEAINRVAFEWGMEHLKKGDIILTSHAEHHSNFVPWQIIAKNTEAIFKIVAPENLKKEIADNVKLVVVTHASNVLGTIFPIKEICELAKNTEAKVAVDGAQAVPHIPVNVQNLGCDFYSFSAHKMLGPMGLGVLWMKKNLLEDSPPYEYGGGMIKTVSIENSTWAEPPEKFEAGTPNVAGVVGLAASVDYLEKLGMKNVQKHNDELMEYTFEKLTKIKGLTILGERTNRVGLISFTIKGIHPHDVAAVLSTQNIAVRAGLHCAMPLHKKLEAPQGSTRVSFHVYNNKKDIDKLVEGIQNALKVLS